MAERYGMTHFVNPLEVDVQHELLVWVPLNGTQQNFLLFAINIHVKNRSVELFLTQGVENFVMVQLKV
jgi:hypothetical protein